MKTLKHYSKYFSGCPDFKNVCSYYQNRLKYSKKGRGEDFKLALKQCDEYLRDPRVNILYSIHVEHLLISNFVASDVEIFFTC